NLTNPPRIFVQRGIGMFHGASAMLRNDLFAAFGTPTDSATARLDREMRVIAATAAAAIDSYAAELERTILPKATGSFAIGRANLEARYRAEELIDQPIDSLIALGLRELDRTEAQFKAAGAKIDPRRSPQEVWLEVRRAHPKPGEVVAAA